MTRDEAINVLERISEDTIQRDCSTCGRTTAGIYSGVCCYCSLCEVVPEVFKDYHERKHFRSYWTWDGKRKNEALEMAISALRQQEHRCPCDLCDFGPPSSMRGKPCTMCPAMPKQGTVSNCSVCSLKWLQMPAGEEDDHA